MGRQKIEMKCEKCGKPQRKDAEKSNDNWSVFNSNQRCECGGKFVMYIDGQKVG